MIVQSKVLAAILVAAISTPSTAADIFYRGTAHAVGKTDPIGDGQPAPFVHGPLALVSPLPFGLTIGTAIAVVLDGGGVSGASYRLAPSVPGLLANGITGDVSGTPEGIEGVSIDIAVEAVAEGRVVAKSPPLRRVLRAPLSIEQAPSSVATTTDEPWPETLFASAGGNASALTWTTSGLPEWLEFVEASPGSISLSLKPGAKIVPIDTTVRVSVKDDEGRQASHDVRLFVEDSDVFGKIVAEDSAENDNFGTSISLSADGTTAMVGAHLDDDKGSASGSAYIFTRQKGTWTQQGKIVATDGAPNDFFGHSVSLSSDGSTALVGAYLDDDKGSASGAAYVFTRRDGTWTQQGKIVPEDGAPNDQFGRAVSLSADGSTAIIGAHLDDDKGSASGSAYIFTRQDGTWTQQGKIVPTDGAADDYFGQSVSLSANGSSALIGAFADDDKGSASGSAYVFTRQNGIWTQQGKIVPADGVPSDQFGFSVSLSADGNTAAVAAHLDDDKGADSGSAYAFTRQNGTWIQQGKIAPTDGAPNDQFGFSIALSADGETMTIGARLDDDKGSASGSAYIFTRQDGTWTQQGKIVPEDGAPNDQFGFSVSLSSNGSVAMIGAPLDDDKGPNSGSAYVLPSRTNR